MMETKTRKALITGASRGIGCDIAKVLLERGDQVVGVSRTLNPLFKDREGFSWLPTDLSNVAQLAAMTRHVAIEHGDLDALICNAGTGDFGSLEEYSTEQIRGFLHLNLTSHILVVRHLLPLLKKRQQGDVIFIGSESALKGGKRGSLYAAAKFGLRGFAQAIRQEASTSGVRVSTIHPGMVRTGFFDALDFEPGPDHANAVSSDAISDAVTLVLDADPSTVFDEIIVNPLKKVIVKKP